MTHKGVANAMRQGMTFIASSQRDDGGFDSFSSPSPTPFIAERTYRTTFTPALILGALSHINTPESQRIRQKLAQWLLMQKSPHWSFNYWAVSAPERKSMPYPDDLDDTFCSLFALYQHNASLIDETCLAQVIKLLFATETQVGGPYKTWLTTNKDAVWQDVDIAVNANVAAFLSLVAEPLPSLTKMMETVIATQTFTSPYYPTVYPLLYYLARAHETTGQPALADCILRLRVNGHWGTPLQTALALSSLARLGRLDAHPQAIDYLLKRQNPDGSWPPEAFCLDPALQQRSYYSGAPALTSAFVLEALNLEPKPSKKTHSVVVSHTNKATPLYDQTLRLIHDECNAQGSAVRRELQAIIKRTVQADTEHEIILLPQLFNQSLLQPLPAAAFDCLTHLGAANLFGWAAYTIYDDFLDNEGITKQLSAANVALRASLRHFKQALPQKSSFQAWVDKTFDHIDNANTWETHHCRMVVTAKGNLLIEHLPRYGNSLSLADRSIGHTLGPTGVLAALGIEPEDPRATAVQLALRHYLVARQLNDDLHDWEQDTRAGIVTYVVTKILHELKVKHENHRLSALIPRMQRQFWHHTLPAICRLIRTHAAAARHAAASSHLLKEFNCITQLADNIDASLAQTLQEQHKAERFLAAYRKSV